ncbi:hypothetical protein ScPMuIL_000321 [Solemya velum]
MFRRLREMAAQNQRHRDAISVYRDLTKKQKNGEEFRWRCALADCVPPDFIRSDIHINGARHIIFATDEQLRLLSDTWTWYLDATFKVVRKPFYQLISIHAFLKSGECTRQAPFAFMFMSRCRKEDYMETLKAVKTSLFSTPDLDEIAAIWGAVKEVFPSVTIHGCTFHWCQAVYRKISELGLQTAYKEKGLFYILLKKLLALPYLPRRHIHPTFYELRQQAGTSESPLQLVAEHSLTTTNRKSSKDRQDKLAQLWTKYEEKTISTKDFLTACISVVLF